MHDISALVIVVPLLLPVAVGYGIDPVNFGIIFIANMQIGYFFPPLGLNLFIASYRFNKPVLELVRATLPFLVILLGSVLIITYWPALSLALVQAQRCRSTGQRESAVKSLHSPACGARDDKRLAPPPSRVVLMYHLTPLLRAAAGAGSGPSPPPRAAD